MQDAGSKNVTRTPVAQPKVVSIKVAAGFLSISVRQVYRLIAAGELTAVRLGRARRIPMDTIDRLIARGGVK